MHNHVINKHFPMLCIISCYVSVAVEYHIPLLVNEYQQQQKNNIIHLVSMSYMFDKVFKCLFNNP